MMRGFVGSFLLLTLLTGCNRSAVQTAPEQQEGNEIASILEQLLQEKINLGIFRSVVEQLNTYYDHHGDPSKKSMAMTPAQEAIMRQMLSELKTDFERARRVDETKNRLFSTSADASYIDACMLFRDAFTALKNDMGEMPSKSEAKAVADYQRDLVKHVHGWTMRQVALRTNPDNIKDWPAHEILRLGMGDSDDRLRVFLGLLGQSDFDTCALVIKTQVRKDNIVENRQVPLLAGVLLENKLYLFDPYLGQPVPGPTPGSIATLEDLKKTPSLLGSRPDAPTPTQLAESELVLLTSLCSLAPRMAVLEKEFDDIKIDVKLKEDAAGRIERFKAAGYTVKPWAAPNRSGFPALVFQKYVETGKGDPRLVDVILPRAKLIPKWAQEIEDKIGIKGSPTSLIYEFDRLFLNTRLEPGGGRDLLVRGKPHQAVARLSFVENRLDRALDNFHKEMEWSLPLFRENFIKPMMDATATLRMKQAQLATVAKGSAQERDLDMDCRRIYAQLESAWKDQNIKGMLSSLGAEWAIPELREHLTYFMGLAKMELAIRSEMRQRRNPAAVWPTGTPTPAEQYATANEWFSRYEALVIPMSSSVWLDAVKLRKQECLNRIAGLQTNIAQAK